MTKKLLLAFLLSTLAFSLLEAGSRRLPSFNGRIVHTATTPSAGTNEIQTLTFGGGTTTGNFKLTYNGETTANIAWTATDATLVSNIDAALEALSSIGTGGVTTAAGTVSSGIGTVTVTFAGANTAKLNVPQMTINTQTTGGTLSVATTTAGVEADGRDLPKGTICIADDTGVSYQNTGSPPNPTWTKISAE
jgi:hypothetical protein